jgi:hypothetical protein
MANTRIKKNFVCEWKGVRGGIKMKKFFTKDARDDFAAQQKAAGFKGVKTKRQTAFKVDVAL